MKVIIIVFLSLIVAGCSLFSSSAHRPGEVVPSCFSDGENQESSCKAQRTNEEGQTVVTRCIGSQNQEAKPALRGKCVEKICTEGSNDCKTRGEFAVLEQYAELVTAKMFADEAAHSKKKSIAKKSKSKNKSAPVREEAEVSIAPDVIVATPEPPPEAAPAPARKVASVSAVESAPAQMSLVLKPVKKASSSTSSRAPASVKSENGFKKVCVSRNETAAPDNIRGKCATRTCAGGKCTYQGRKEMFDWVARAGS